MKVKKKILSFMIIVNILTINIFYIFCSAYNVKAASAGASVASNIASYFLGSVGALDTSSGGAISGVSTSVKDRIAQSVASYLGTGIYTDSNDNYVFSGEATQGLFDALYGNNNGNFRIVSNFGSGIMQNSLAVSGNGYYPNDFFYDQNMNSMLPQGDYIIGMVCINDGNIIYTQCRILELPSNFAYFSFTNNGTLYAKDINGYDLTCNVRSRRCAYVVSSGNWINSSDYQWSQGTDTRIFFGSDSSSYLSQRYFYGSDTSSLQKNMLYSSLGYSIPNNLKSFYSVFPCGSFWCNKSIIIGMNNAAGLQGYNNQNNNGIQVANTFNVLPSISQSVIDNNNWNNIYNSYVTNVSQNYNDLGGNTETFDYNLLHSLMSKFSNNIVTAVENGTEDIENAIFTTNDWLRRVYERCGQIVDLVNASNTTLDNIESILSAISRIESSLSSELLQLQQTYTLLGQILTAIQNINSGGGGGGGSGSVVIANDWPDLVLELNNLPNADILDFIDKGDILKDILLNSVPFCFVGFIGVIINGLSSTPVTPRFEIPFKMTNNLQYEENVVIDLAQFSSIHDILIGLQVIAFVIWLIYITFALSKVLYQFLS